MFCSLALTHDTDFQKDLLMNVNNKEDLRNYWLSTSGIGEMVQNDIDLNITDGRLNDARVRHQLNPYYKM